MASPSTSSGRSMRHHRRNRQRQNDSSVVDVDEYNAETSATCIDLTADVSAYDVIDLTSGHNITIMDSPIVVLTPADDLGPVRRRGSGRRGRHRNNSRQRLNISVDLSRSQNTIHSYVHVSEDSDSDMLEHSLEETHSGATANNSILRSPEAVKISCPVCMDDTKQIHRSGKQVVSTTCGHIFCDTCIKAAINAQHACPTCRKKLQHRNVHPLFL